MDAEQRREAILSVLQNTDKAISATALAARFSVSRQIIVGDVALLRASGNEITATPRGYLLHRELRRGQLLRKIACCHTAEKMQDELYAMVDEGCTVKDVIVEHPLYGQLAGTLELSSRHDADEFLRSSADAAPLSLLTGGIHLHSLLCPDEAAFLRVCKKLETLGILCS